MVYFIELLLCDIKLEHIDSIETESVPLLAFDMRARALGALIGVRISPLDAVVVHHTL